jgi:hypothetical protein
MPELTLTPAGFTILPDGTPLLAVVETRRERRWFRTVERSETCSYALKAGRWWGREGAVPHRDPRHRRLCEIAVMERVRASVDGAVGYG